MDETWIATEVLINSSGGIKAQPAVICREAIDCCVDLTLGTTRVYLRGGEVIDCNDDISKFTAPRQ